MKKAIVDQAMSLNSFLLPRNVKGGPEDTVLAVLEVIK